MAGWRNREFRVFPAQPELTHEDSPAQARADRAAAAAEEHQTAAARATLTAPQLNALDNCADRISQSPEVTGGSAEYAAKEDAYDRALVAFTADPQYVTQSRQWAACMATKGHSYATPLAPYVHYHLTALGVVRGTTTADAQTIVEEKRTAIDSVTCGGPVRDFLNDANNPSWTRIAETHGL